MHTHLIVLSVAAGILLSNVCLAADPEAPKVPDRNRLVSLTSALIAGVHWGQVALREGTDTDYKGKGDAKLFALGDLKLDDAKNLNADVAKILALPSEDVLAWAQGNDSPKTAELDRLVQELNARPAPADPKLPVNVLIAYMSKRLTGPEEFFVRAVANIGQLNLEIDRDGDQVQDMLKFYIALGMHQIYLPATDEEQITAGKDLAAQSGSAPYDTDADAYHMMFKKLNVWFDKMSGKKDKTTLAKDLLQDPDVQALIPALKALPPKRVAFLGHSLMMSLHWSTYGSWCDIAGEVVKMVNPNFDYKDFQSGGLTPTRAVKEHLANLLAYKPTDAYLMLFVRSAADRDAMTKIVNDLTAGGAEVYIINDVRIPRRTNTDLDTFISDLTKKPHVHFVDYISVAKAAPGHEAWPAVDGIHMQTPGHLFFAKETLKRWAEQK